MGIMQKIMRKIKITPGQQIALFFFIGVIGGTIYGNLAGKENILGGFTFSNIANIPNMSSISSISSVYSSLSSSNGVTSDKTMLFHIVFGQRLSETVLLWIVGMTAISIPCICLFSVGYGFVSGFFLAVCVMQKGVLGILFFWGMLMPQYLIYIPLWYHMALWAYQDSKKTHMTAMISAVLLIGVASVLESYLNPMIIKFIF